MDILEHIPFSSSRKYSLVKYDVGTYALGALEYITNNQIDDYEELEKFVEKGYRIITLVKCKENFNKEDLLDYLNENISDKVLLDNGIDIGRERLEEYYDEDLKQISWKKKAFCIT